MKNLTREQKAKKWFETNPYYSYIERNEYNQIIYRQYPDGDWQEITYDEYHRIYEYICYKTTDHIIIMNIIQK